MHKTRIMLYLFLNKPIRKKQNYVSYTKLGLGCTCFNKPIRKKQNTFHTQN